MFHGVRHHSFLKQAADLVQAAGHSQPSEPQKRIFSTFFNDRNLIAEYRDTKGKIISFLVPALIKAGGSESRPHTLIVVDTEDEVVKIKETLRTFEDFFPGKFWIFLMDSENILKELPLLSKNPAIIVGTTNHIIDHIRRNNVVLGSIQSLIVDITGDSGRDIFDKNILFISTKLSRGVHISVFLPNSRTLNSLKDMIRRPVLLFENIQENRIMAKLDEEKVKKQIEQFISVIKDSEDPLLLKEYKKIIKKNVPFHLRGYFFAFTFKALTAGSKPMTSSFSRKTSSSVKKPANIQTLFINIGKTRRVYPKDLSRFFQSSLAISPEMIGTIKVLANYSFVDLDKSVADEAVEKMDGSSFRGKKITVNFARKKED